jgi:NitT/TauT family transport system substrate-binding protein
MIAFRGTNLMMTALLSGEIDDGTFLPFFVGAAARGLPLKIAASMTKSVGYGMIARPEIPNVLSLRGKKIGINSFGSSADFAAYTAISASGLDPNRNVTFLPIGGSTPERLAALASGAVEATVLTSPNEFNAEKQGFKTLVSMKDLAKLVRIPVTGMAVGQKKIERESGQIVRVLRALRRVILMIQEQPAYGVALFQKVLRLDGNSAKEFYGYLAINTILNCPCPIASLKSSLPSELSAPKKKTRHA